MNSAKIIRAARRREVINAMKNFQFFATLE